MHWRRCRPQPLINYLWNYGCIKRVDDGDVLRVDPNDEQARRTGELTVEPIVAASTATEARQAPGRKINGRLTAA